MYPTILRYSSAFGDFTIPPEVEARALRLKHRFGRANYLDEWCRWQWVQGRG